jgi:phosphohistidine swiveling domain-containing protein
MDPLILNSKQFCPRRLVGGKASNLAALQHAGFCIPAWFVITPEAFFRSLDDATLKLYRQKQWEEDLVERLLKTTPSTDISRQVMAEVQHLCPLGQHVAVRSSAIDEDGLEHSFAGQLDSFLFVPLAEVMDRVASVWRSGFSERITRYRSEAGLLSVPSPPAVLIQRMIAADSAGVAFSADPVSGQRGVRLVSSVFGLGDRLVAGECNGDTFRVDRSGSITRRDIAEKQTRQFLDTEKNGDIRTEPLLPEMMVMPSLEDSQVIDIARLAHAAGCHFGRPQDIEWAIEDKTLYLLQSRPITTVSEKADPDGTRVIWDNSNIIESYGGICMPLTFSFARFVYAEVYRQFCRILLVPKVTIDCHASTFRLMLGLVRGRVYYNLLSWYRVLAMLPGYRFNRKFMEQMMGFRETLPEDLDPADSKSAEFGKVIDSLRFVRSLGGLVWQQVVFPITKKRFSQRLETSLAKPCPPLEDRRPDEIIEHYQELERSLLTRWDAPLVNDFFAMIYFGLLSKLCSNWINPDTKTLQNDLISSKGEIISVEPVRKMKEMAKLAAGDQFFVQALRYDELEDIRCHFPAYQDFYKLYKAYLEKFGDRCLEELKLESPTLHDNPLPLLRAIGQLAKRGSGVNADRPAGREKIRDAGEEKVQTALKGKPAKRLLFTFILGQARNRIRDRENLRYERTRVFGRVRRIFVELGKRFFEMDRISDPADIFYLEVPEILGFVQGTTATTDLDVLVDLRKRQYKVFGDLPNPDDHFETRGSVNHGQSYKEYRSRDEIDVEMADLQGLGCCSGVIQGRLRVVTDPQKTEIQEGEILVAERTDPGWILLFSACSGLLVERGSLLSHSAIVAREMGIPAVVSLPGLTKWAKNGDWVEMDGGKGTVRRLDRHAMEDA